MKKLNFNKLKKYLPFLLLIAAIVCCNLGFADVGNNNRYSSDGGGGGMGGDFDIGVLVGWLINLFIESPILGLIVVVAIIMLSRSSTTSYSTTVPQWQPKSKKLTQLSQPTSSTVSPERCS